MRQYKNKKTGVTVEVSGEVVSPDWEEVTETEKAPEKKNTRRKAKE